MAAAPNKYESIRDQVLDLVHGLDVGAAIPAERELCEQFGVSRMTLRRAVDDLVREGYLDRRHGSGTFVAEPKIAQQLTMTSFSEDMRRRGLVPSSQTLSLTTVTAGAPLGRHLEISPRAQVRRVRRLRLADDRPMAIETLHVPSELVPGLQARDLVDTSFYELLAERYGIEIGAGLQTIEPTVLNAEEGELLDVPEHSPAFLFERTSRSVGGRIVEFVRSVYRGDRYQLQVELRPPRTRGGRADGERVSAQDPAIASAMQTHPNSPE
ncbi:GntR family transcriptional regulator [Egibacter rhizosphaerae]|uniref:GntR family transcriptional regulator n=1 Tax=Egibacter rhizosphaerae TaxID=1670831 RepID=A0A411YDB6_9ACTN|nr:GntR family transcriptional regulator [Egibacter rhizosphaerae]QBI19213.1 GntR family transcriptional regulator [Egibacter rhizosphaerae]